MKIDPRIPLAIADVLRSVMRPLLGQAVTLEMLDERVNNGVMMFLAQFELRIADDPTDPMRKVSRRPGRFPPR